MSLPGITKITQVDGSLGLVPVNTSAIPLKLGVCSKGNYNVLYSFSNIADAKSTLGEGKLVDDIATTLDTAGAPVYAMRMLTSVSGIISDITKLLVGSSDGAFATTLSAPIDDYDVIVQLVKAGKVGTQPYPTFIYSLDGGNTYTSEINVPSGGTYTVDNTGLKFVFSNGAVGFKSGDTFKFTTVGTTFNNSDLSTALTAALAVNQDYGFIHVVGPCSATLAGTVDTYMETANGPLVKRFIHGIVETRDQGWRTVLSTSAQTFPFTAVAGDTLVITVSYDNGSTIASTCTYTFAAATYANIAALVADLNVTSFTKGLFSVGAVSNELSLSTVSNKGNTILKVDSTSTGIGPAKVAYTASQLSIGETEDTWINALATDFNAFSSLRVSVCAGSAYQYSSATKRYQRRSCGNLVAARTALVPISEDLGNVSRGALVGIIVSTPDGSSGLIHDEDAKQGLDQLRFTTLRRIKGLPGYFITNGRIFAPNGSDFTYTQNRRVIDKATELMNTAAAKYTNISVRANSNGTIYEIDARTIEKAIYSYMYSVLRNDISKLEIQVDRSQNIVGTLTMKVRANILPLGYAKFIELTIGFTPPILKV